MNTHRQRRYFERLFALVIASLLLVSGLPAQTAAKGPKAPIISRAVAVTSYEVDISWIAPLNGGATGYVIRRDRKDLATVDASTFNYADKTVQPGNKYMYSVAAIGTGNGRSNETTPTKVKTPDLPELGDRFPPSEPEGFTVNPLAEGGILLDWDEGGTDDTDIGGYRVYRDGELLVTLDSATLSYLDSTAVPGTTYTYEIESVDTVGKSSEREHGQGAATKYPDESVVATMNATTATESAAATLAVETSGLAPQLKRYPYLTDVVDKYAIINWATDRSAISGSAKWGPVAADGTCNPTNTVDATRIAMTVHGVSEYQWKAVLTLAPNTQYCYRVFLKTVDLLGSDPSPRFWTQIPAGSNESYSFAVFGDWGSAGSETTNPDEANVLQQVANSGARFALTLGDNAYQSGSQQNYGDLYETGPSVSGVFGPDFWAGPGRSMSIFPTSGNHGFSSSTSDHPELTNFPQDNAVALSGGRYQRDTYCCQNGTESASYPSAWYAFDAGNARFYVLSAAWADNNVGTSDMYENDYDYHWTISADEYQWLENDLQNHPTGLKFAFFHFPIYSDNTAQLSDTFLQGEDSLQGLLGRYGVNIAFNGHAHIYQRTLPDANGLMTYVSGGGGSKVVTVRGCKPNTAYAIGWSYASNEGTACGSAPVPTSPEQVYHFLLVTVNGNTVTVAPTDELGRTFDVQTYTFNTSGGGDTQAPSAPSNLQATAASGTQVDLSWTAATDNLVVTGYDVYRNGTLIDSLGVTTSYSDTTVAPSTTYNYTVKAKDAAGNVSQASNTATVTTPAAATLTFTAVADTYADQLNPTTNFGTSVKVTSDNSPVREGYFRFNVTGLTGPVQSATLRLWVTDSTGNGPAVYGVTDNTWSETGLTWNNKPGHGATATDNKGAVSKDIWVEYDVTPLVTGNGAVSFALIADSSDGLDVFSREGTNKPQLVITASTSGGDTQAPSAPSNLQATASSGSQVDLTWTAANDNVGVTGYDVFRNGSLIKNLGVVTSYSDTTASPSTTYNYTVKAKDAAGNVSQASNTATVTTPAGGTTTTATFTAVADTYVSQVDPTTNFGTAVKVTSDNSPVQEGYFRFNVTGLSGPVQSATLRLWVTDSTGNGPAVYGVTDTTWSETGLTWNNKPTHGTTPTDNKGAIARDIWVEYNVTPLVTGNGAVSFALIADSSDGLDVFSREGTNKPQLVITASTSGGDTEAPLAPTNLQATAASSSQIDLIWTAADDNVGVTGYEVLRGGTPIKTLGVTTSYADTTVAPSTSYSYTVKARDAAGNFSQASNTATVTTPAGGTTTTSTFTVVADTYVSQVDPTANFGTAVKVTSDNSPVQEGYFRFAVSGLSGSVQSATLRLWVTDSTRNGPAVYGMTDNTWSESGMTWDNKPGHEATPTDNKGEIARDIWVEYDVTPLVTGNGDVSFALIADSSDGLDVFSREGTNKPQLVVTTNTGP